MVPLPEEVYPDPEASITVPEPLRTSVPELYDIDLVRSPAFTKDPIVNFLPFKSRVPQNSVNDLEVEDVRSS